MISSMKKDYPGEQWKPVRFNINFETDFRLEVSNFGRLRTFNKVSNGNIVKGSMIDGYRIFRSRFFRARDQQTQDELDYLQEQALILARKRKAQIKDGENEEVITATTALLNDFKKNISKKFADDVKKRTVQYHALFHRLVAEYFCTKPSAEHTVVAHLDHNKLNNRAGNLKWMTPQENYQHQKSSPKVIAHKLGSREELRKRANQTKLSVTKVMLLKKLLTEGKPVKQLVKQFKVTDTQIFRIKRGENWADIEAAK
jgi:hypothetical protein